MVIFETQFSVQPKHGQNTTKKKTKQNRKTNLYIYLYIELAVLVIWHIHLCWLFNAKSIFMQMNSCFKQFSLVLIVKNISISSYSV